ncbi:MAG: type II toxin-antitoxin system RelE/ParE family toxin, partial [Bacteroidia bacterium]
VRSAVLKVIERVEGANNISEVQNVRKLSGHKSAYRIRIGDYRIGIFVTNRVIEFARIVHRKDIYKVFP